MADTDTPGVPLDDDDLEEMVLVMVEHGIIRLGITEDGDIGVWRHKDDICGLAYASGATATEALYEAARRAAEERKNESD